MVHTTQLMYYIIYILYYIYIIYIYVHTYRVYLRSVNDGAHNAYTDTYSCKLRYIYRRISTHTILRFGLIPKVSTRRSVNYQCWHCKCVCVCVCVCKEREREWGRGGETKEHEKKEESEWELGKTSCVKKIISRIVHGALLQQQLHTFSTYILEIGQKYNVHIKNKERERPAERTVLRGL